MKTIYNYDETTGQYISFSQARIDPRNPDRVLMPANSTEIEPPVTPEGKYAVFDGEAWGLLDIPVEAPAEDPVLSPLDLAKADRDSALSDMVYVTEAGDTIQCREQDEQSIRNAIELMTRKSLALYTWFSVGDTKVSVTKADLEAAIISGQDQGAAIWQSFFIALTGGE